MSPPLHHHLLLLLSLLSSPPTSNALQIDDAFFDVVTAVPACGLQCVLDLTPGINASCLATESSTTCLCEGDMEHYTRVLNCVQAQCTVEESIGEFCDGFPNQTLYGKKSGKGGWD